MIQHKTSIHVNCPAERVFAFLVDMEQLPAWQANLIKAEALTAGPLRAGSHVREVRRLRGKETQLEAEISGFEPNHRLATTTLGTPKVTVLYALDPLDGGTQLRYEFAMQTAGLMRLLEPVILSGIRKESQADLQRLKQLLES